MVQYQNESFQSAEPSEFFPEKTSNSWSSLRDACVSWHTSHHLVFHFSFNYSEIQNTRVKLEQQGTAHSPVIKKKKKKITCSDLSWSSALHQLSRLFKQMLFEACIRQSVGNMKEEEREGILRRESSVAGFSKWSLCFLGVKLVAESLFYLVLFKHLSLMFMRDN